jgi:NTP pyrophosphatase (non-canonical NTP hydrolase)
MAGEALALAGTRSVLHQHCCNYLFPSFFHSFSGLNISQSVDKRGETPLLNLTAVRTVPTITKHGFRMARFKSSSDQNVLEFPDGEARPILGTHRSASVTLAKQPPVDVVISGSYRKQFETLKQTYEQFRDMGCTILSPSSVSIVHEDDGFVYMRGEETQTPESIEERHLDAIQKANFVWLHAPEGYVGPMAALEIGYASAVGVPVYARELPSDRRFQPLVRLVDSPADLMVTQLEQSEPPAPPALRAFQEYYRRAATRRGYAKERPKDCLLLMIEEIGELARALRKREKLVRHGSYPDSNEAHELADVFLYVVHMANVLGLDLAEVVQQKEYINIEKFLARK